MTTVIGSFVLLIYFTAAVFAGAFAFGTTDTTLESVFMHCVHTNALLPVGKVVFCKFGYFRLQFVGL